MKTKEQIEAVRLLYYHMIHHAGHLRKEEFLILNYAALLLEWVIGDAPEMFLGEEHFVEIDRFQSEGEKFAVNENDVQELLTEMRARWLKAAVTHRESQRQGLEVLEKIKTDSIEALEAKGLKVQAVAPGQKGS